MAGARTWKEAQVGRRHRKTSRPPALAPGGGNRDGRPAGMRGIAGCAGTEDCAATARSRSFTAAAAAGLVEQARRHARRQDRPAREPDRHGHAYTQGTHPRAFASTSASHPLRIEARTRPRRVDRPARAPPPGPQDRRRCTVSPGAKLIIILIMDILHHSTRHYSDYISFILRS